ncbi:MAG: NAD(P)-dependent oxidoreductase [Phycisphaeraceae bacterium]
MNRAELQLLAELSDPDEDVIRTLSAMQGDLIFLGAGGKIGQGLALMARRAFIETGASNRVIAVSRFSDPQARANLEEDHIHTMACDLTDAGMVRDLPDASHVVYMTGVKFGTQDNPGQTWVTNTCIPAIVAQRYCDSSIVAFSSGNVYPYFPVDSQGPDETVPLSPVGEYGWSVVGRERVLDYYSRLHGTPMTILRLNYANEPRYGVMVDIAVKVMRSEPIDVTMGYVNVLWQTDSNRVTLKAFDVCDSPPAVLNLAGPEAVSVRELAGRFGERLGVEPIFTGSEATTALLSNASACWAKWGPPEAELDHMIGRISEWLMAGYPTWNRPTHYEQRSGSF